MPRPFSHLCRLVSDLSRSFPWYILNMEVKKMPCIGAEKKGGQR